MKNKKITIVALHLNYGGTEQTITKLANYLCHNYDVNILCTYKINKQPAFELDPKIKVKYLINTKPNKEEFLTALHSFKLIKLIKEGFKSLKILYQKKHLLIKELKKLDTDVIISTRAFHNNLVGKYASNNILKIAWEHNHHQDNSKYINKTIKAVSKIDYFVLVSKELTNFYQDKVKPQCVYIPNTIDLPLKEKHKPLNKLIAIGRLEPEKGFSDLITIFAKFYELNPHYTLTIIGDGSEKLKLEKEIKQSNLESVITLTGFLPSSKAHEELSTSKVYLMTSYTESFGIVLIEAMSHHVPCLAFTSARGAMEIIKNDYNGYLIENRDLNKYVNTLNNLVNNQTKYNELSNNSYLTSQKYDSNIINKKWLKLVESPKIICYNKEKEDVK